MKRAPYCAAQAIPLIEAAASCWLYESGIGEDRAALIQRGTIVEAKIERHGGVKAGLICSAKIAKKLPGSGRAIVLLEGGGEALLRSIPQGLTEGQSLTVQITREAIDEKSRHKWQLAKASDAPPADAPSLLEAITATGIEVRHCHAHEADHFADAAWHDCTEQAQSGIVPFAGGSLDIAITPAMTVMDVDGELPARELAMAAAPAAALAIRRLGLQGSIGIDFPDSGDRAARQAVAEAFDAAMTTNCERTAINGFGFMQIVTRRVRPSLPECIQGNPALAQAMALLRLAERDSGSGPMEIAAHPAVAAKLDAHSDWMEMLARRTGRSAALRADPKIAMGGGYVQ